VFFKQEAFLAKVERLPTQHRDRPHCPVCKRELLAFEDILFSVGNHKDRAALIAVTFHVQCACGHKYDLRVGVKQ
jgi:hypothetical protein